MMGTPIFASIVCEKIIEYHKIIAVFTQPDKPIGRKAIITPPPLKLTALAHNIKVFQPNVIDSAAIEILSSLKPDVIIVVAYGKILPKSVVDRFFCINIHASILPKYRGASPIQQMILSDDELFGVSIMKMNEGLDSGDILSIKRIARVEKNAIELGKILAKLGSGALLEVLNKLDSITPIPQEHNKASYCKKITKHDGLIEFDNAKDIAKKYLAYTPWPGIYLKSGLKLFDVALERGCGSFRKGEILSYSTNVVVGCLEGVLNIGFLQAPSKNKSLAIDYLRAKNLNIGDTLA